MMSAWELTDARASRPAATPPARPRLTSILGGRGAAIPTIPFAGIVVAILVAGMVGLLALNVHLENQAFQLSRAQTKAATLALEVSDKQAQVYAKSGPEQLGAAASALGMVPNPHPGFVDLRSGQILGSPKAVTGDEMPALKVRPAASAPAPTATTPVESNVQPWFDLAAATAAASAPASPSAQPSAPATPATPAPVKPAASAKPTPAKPTTPKPTKP